MIKAWLKVVGMGLAKWPCKLAAPFVVPFLNDAQRKYHFYFGVRDASDLSWWNIGVRNACHNMFERATPEFLTRTNTHDDTLEMREGIQWRFRQSIGDGEYVSFRVTWGKPRRVKGKREFYVGWTMNEKPFMRLTFFQFRPF